MCCARRTYEITFVRLLMVEAFFGGSRIQPSYRRVLLLFLSLCRYLLEKRRLSCGEGINNENQVRSLSKDLQCCTPRDGRAGNKNNKQSVRESALSL